MTIKQKVRKGLRNPRGIVPYLLRRYFTDRRLGGRVTFDLDQFVSSPDNIVEFTSKYYREVSTIQALLKDHTTLAARALEVGCGYARLTPWLNTIGDDIYGVDINTEILPKARTQHPEISFFNGAADSLPFNDDTFDVILTWTVLHHIPPNLIQQSADELNRVLRDEGILLICEKTKGNSGNHVWTRSPEEYQSLFNSLSLATARPKPVEPTWFETKGTDEITESVMVFK